MFQQNYSTPLGNVVVKATNKGLTSMAFEDKVTETKNMITIQAIKWLDDYFNGRSSKAKLPLDIKGTPFRLKVWGELLKVPYGKTWSYGRLAEAIGAPKAARAVGQAVHFNPIGIYIPCHRIIGKDGSLTGYAGGLHYKEWLLRHEKEKRED